MRANAAICAQFRTEHSAGPVATVLPTDQLETLARVSGGKFAWQCDATVGFPSHGVSKRASMRLFGDKPVG
jgi:hypothetical protein